MTEKATKSRRRNLQQHVTEDIRRRIDTEELSPGDKLPTEQQLIAEFGVSRTVIREAISALKADGLVTSRQGAGVFVLERPTQTNPLHLRPADALTIAELVESLELRAAVELSSAELAAQRCSPAQEIEIYTKFSEFSRKVDAGEPSEAEDFAFHVAIAEATNNKKFVEFLTLMGRNNIPRSKLRKEANLPRDPELEAQILDEHREIMDAISAKKPDLARAAMRKHLMQSAERYRLLAKLS